MTAASIKALIEARKPAIARRLSAVWQDKSYLPEVIYELEQGEIAIKLLQEYCERPSKRVRGSLSMVSHDMVGGDRHEASEWLAAALELSQNYLLIVDDVMDRSPTRRGGKTVHEMYKEVLGDLGIKDLEHVAGMIAITVGIVAQHIASQIVESLPLKNIDNLRQINKTFQQNIMVTGFGQISDLALSFSPQLDEQRILAMYKQKSSYYTFVNPMQCGALLAENGATYRAEIEAFGVPAGLAYQLSDDLIGLFGNETISGKLPTDDVREGKMTLPIFLTLKHASEAQKKTIRAVLGVQGLARNDYMTVATVAKELGVDKKTTELIEKYVTNARHVVDKQTAWSAEGKDFLGALLDFISDREH